MFQNPFRLLLLITDGDLIIEDQATAGEPESLPVRKLILLLTPEGIKAGEAAFCRIMNKGQLFSPGQCPLLPGDLRFTLTRFTLTQLLKRRVIYGVRRY